jgi:hypothetical protein
LTSLCASSSGVCNAFLTSDRPGCRGIRCRPAVWPRRPQTARPAEDEGGVAFNRACLRRGLIGNIVRMPGQMSICRIAAPLTIAYDELDRGLAIPDEVLTVGRGSATLSAA